MTNVPSGWRDDKVHDRQIDADWDVWGFVKDGDDLYRYVERNNYKFEHLQQKTGRLLKTPVLLQLRFFLTVSPDSMMAVAKHWRKTISAT